MTQLFTVDRNNNSPALMGVSFSEFQADLVDPITKVYVYVGKEEDRGWKNALLASGILASLNPYLANNLDDLRQYVPVGSPIGIVFGTDDQPDRLLDAAEAAVFKIVNKANGDAA